MILLDTNALIWLAAGHRRAAPLDRAREGLAISPVSLLELRLLEDSGKVRVPNLAALTGDRRWTIDEPSPLVWFQTANDLSWTRDIFDRLIVAHAVTRRFKLATADTVMIENLPKAVIVEL